ncbi:MAG TPA: hypothetical protein VKN18_19045 [Blastocatellia bacterium]|nr:hypothetical protein [Blastocatellia bacterium]
MPRRLTKLGAAIVALSVSSAALAATLSNPRSKTSTKSLAHRALATDKAESEKAIGELRSMGAEGLRLFLETNRSEIDAAAAIPGNSHNRVLEVLDSVCQQKDCYASRLYWYTDLEQAKDAARAQQKPILSLRLLGRLDEDLSCANSRLFRITLYANEQVSRLLREQFILHWQSVRPVPKVTIDFGDGRLMERTLTGNSVHYVLDSEGHFIDALPGLYGPAAFLHELNRLLIVASFFNAPRTPEERRTELRRYHQSRLTETETAWMSDIKRAGLLVAPSREIPIPPAPGANPPSAQKAAPITVAKVVSIERPVLRGFVENPKLLDSVASDAGWSTLARMHFLDASIDNSTQALMTFKDPALTGGNLQLATIALRQAIAEDTVRNEYIYRARFHRWLASGDVSSDVMSLTEKIYAELFLTPGWDAWLGLRPTGLYSGIDGDGVRK